MSQLSSYLIMRLIVVGEYKYYNIIHIVSLDIKTVENMKAWTIEH